MKASLQNYIKMGEPMLLKKYADTDDLKLEKVA